jgi:hypothetical protein
MPHHGLWWVAVVHLCTQCKIDVVLTKLKHNTAQKQGLTRFCDSHFLMLSGLAAHAASVLHVYACCTVLHSSSTVVPTIGMH